MIAIVLVVLSSLSALAMSDLNDRSENVDLTVEELEEMNDLSLSAKVKIDMLAFQAVVRSCSGDTTNECKMRSGFISELDRSAHGVYPQERGNYRIEVNISDIRLSFLRLSLSNCVDLGEGWQGEFVPAYVGLNGNFEVKVSTNDGNLTRVFPASNDVKVPWPLLKDRMAAFDSTVGNGLGDLTCMARGMLDSLATYRSLQGWGTACSSIGQGIDDMVTERDVLNALNLGLVILQYQIFRTADPCLEIFTDHMSPQASWDHVRGYMEMGGAIDPVDLFLGLYGCDELDWGAVFSQTIYASMDRTILRWMEYLQLVDAANILEDVEEAFEFGLNDIIEWISGTDLLEDQYKDWIKGKFEIAGLPDTLYRYLNAGIPDDRIIVPTRNLELITADGQSVILPVQGMVSMDFPTVDVLDWDGWGDFREQYEKSTKELIDSMRERLMIIAESVSRNMYLPPDSLILDPTDGMTFLDEIRSVLLDALERKDEWLRPAIGAGEQQVDTVDHLAEATKSLFLERKYEILDRDSSLDDVARSVAGQLLTEMRSSNPGLDLPWEENFHSIEQAIFLDEGWSMMDRIVDAYELNAASLTDNFLNGMSYRSTISGHRSSFMVDIIVAMGDPLIGLGMIISDDVRSLMNEISKGMGMRDDFMEVPIPRDDHFDLTDEMGRSYQETLDVEMEYLSFEDVGTRPTVLLTDPVSYVGQEGSFPQSHDTNLLEKKWASFQSVWGLVCSGNVGIKLSPGGDLGASMPLTLEGQVPLTIYQTISILSGQPLLGVHYQNTNTLIGDVATILEKIFRPLLDGIEAVSSGLQKVYRLLENAVKRLLDMGTKILDALSNYLQELVEKVQQFVRAVVLGPTANAVEAAAGLLGERTCRLNLFGLDLVIRTDPTDMAFQDVSIPASFSLSYRVGECSISVTSRLIKGSFGFGFLSNASLNAEDWSVHIVLDPFMDVFRHMVEVRGIVRGACIELTMPEIVSYQELSFALSDIPGVSALLSNIPLPLPGLKGSVDAGVYVKMLDGRCDSPVINEYELNPMGEDYGREWVELYNPTDEMINLTGWTLQTSHGAQALGSIGDAVLAPHGRFVYYFKGQALDNQANGFPAEESIVLRDQNGRRIDSTPFATDYWNDERTWQRTQDGTDRWEFREGTEGRSNGKDPFTRLDLTTFEQAFVSAVTESISQLSSGEPSMETLADTLSSTVLHIIERLAADILEREVEMGLFVEVSVNDYTSAMKTGLRMDLSVHCGTLGEMLERLGRSTASLIHGFGNPFRVVGIEPPSNDDIWVGISTFCSVGLPDIVSVPGLNLEVQYVTSIQANLASLNVLFGERSAGWGLQGGVAICGVPGYALPMLQVPSTSMVDIWICRASVHEMVT